ncbi:MAG: hypothetical protein JXN63_06475 [Candidatus Delongbacteria bacterium]|nr:hypothetical protein [Candidatus Delongbacteria bacterium]
MKKFYVLIFTMILAVTMAVTNPCRTSFEKYFAVCHSRESEGLLRAVEANIFVNNALKKCRYDDYFLITLVKVPVENGELTYIGAFNKWIEAPFK